MNISYTVFTVILLLFGITILILSSIGFTNWNRLYIPDNIGCTSDFPSKNITNLSVNKNVSNNFIQFSDPFPCNGIKNFNISLDIKSQRIPFVIGAQYSMDKKVWVDIPDSQLMSKVGGSQQGFSINENINFIRLQIVSQGEGVEFNSIKLDGEVYTQLSRKNVVNNSYIFLIVLCCIVFIIFGVSVWIRYQKKSGVPERIPSTPLPTKL